MGCGSSKPMGGYGGGGGGYGSRGGGGYGGGGYGGGGGGYGELFDAAALTVPGLRDRTAKLQGAAKAASLVGPKAAAQETPRWR